MEKIYYAFIIHQNVVQWACINYDERLVRDKLKAKMFDWNLHVKHIPKFGYIPCDNASDIMIQTAFQTVDE